MAKDGSIKEKHPHSGGWMGDITLGMSDGLITTTGFVMALASAGVSKNIIVISVLAEALAGSVSGGLAMFLSERTRSDMIAKRIAVEKEEILTEPDEERNELRDIYTKKGLSGDVLDDVVAALTTNHDLWLKTMVHDEHGIIDDDAKVKPSHLGLKTGFSFLIGSIIPSIPFFIFGQVGISMVVSLCLAIFSGVAIGLIKSRYTLRSAVYASLEFILIGGFGVLAGAIIGRLL